MNKIYAWACHECCIWLSGSPDKHNCPECGHLMTAATEDDVSHFKFRDDGKCLAAKTEGE